MTADRPPATTKLLTDAMLGTLGRWLRLLGYDTAMAGQEPDALLARQARAEGRTILTRDRDLARRRGIEVLLIDDDDLDGQLVQVARRLALSQPDPGSRCWHCNTVLDEVTTAGAAEQVPPYVLRTQGRFRRCPNCQRVYWRGSHWGGLEQKLALFQEALARKG